MRRFVTIGPAFLVLLTTALVLFAAPSTLRAMQIAGIQAQVHNARVSLASEGVLDAENRELSNIAQSVLPSVVHLSVRYGRGFGGTTSNASAWIYDQQGHIVTNAHAVANASVIRAELYDGRVERAQIVGVDPKTDIAVLKIDPGPGVIPTARDNADQIRIGHRVFAFGSPFGIKFSMSSGIVSGMGRSDGASFVRGIAGYTNYIQSDAAINPGNSGGPLVDTNGNIVGMNTSIANAPSQDGSDGPTGQSAGIGFAIPLKTLISVVDQLLDHQVILRGYLGVRPARTLGILRDPITNQVVDKGVTIANVPANEPAFHSGIRPGDVITMIGNRETPDFSVLRSVVSVLEPGKITNVRLVREDQEMVLPVRIGAAIDDGGGIRYLPGSESLTENEIRSRIANAD